MDMRTILILLNIAIIGIIAVILVKVYYKDDETEPASFENNDKPIIQSNTNSGFDIDNIQSEDTDDSFKDKFTGIINKNSVKDKIISAKDSGKDSLKQLTQDNSKKESQMDHSFDYDDYETEDIILTENYENHIAGLEDLKENANLPEERVASNVFQEPIEQKHKNIMEQNQAIKLSEPKLVTKESAKQPTTINETPNESITDSQLVTPQETPNESISDSKLVTPNNEISSVEDPVFRASEIEDSTFKGPTFEDVEDIPQTVPEEVPNEPTTIEEKYAEKESELEDIFDDEINSITPIHEVSPEETKEFFEQLDSETSELTSEEQKYFETLEEEFDDNLVASKTDDLSIDISSKPKVEEKVPEPVEDNEFERLLKGESVATPTTNKKINTKTNTKSKTPLKSKVARFSINGTEQTLKKGTSIIYIYHGETYESSIKQIKDGKILVTYRRQNVWIKPSDIKKVF